jgi:hypothetical protein
VIRKSAERSRELLGTDRLALLYAHVEDPRVPLEETVEGFAELIADGTVGLLGVSNHWSWWVEQARALAAARGLPGYEVLQYHYSYLRPRMDLPGRRSPDGDQGVLSGELLSYLKFEPELALVAYSPQLSALMFAPIAPWTANSTILEPRSGRPPCGRWSRKPARPRTRWSWPGSWAAKYQRFHW